MINTKEVIFSSSNRSFGNMSLYYGDTEHALDNRKAYLLNLGVDWQKMVCAKQVHSDNAHIVVEKDAGKGASVYDDSLADTDAFITDKRDIPIAIFTADCLPVFLHDRKNKAIGLVHAGWRSSSKGLVSKVILMMRKHFASKPEDILMHLGPSIRNCCYEVGQEFKGYFPGSVNSFENKLFLSLADANIKQALSLGVDKDNIKDCGICTSCRNDDFFSFRREGPSCGRTLSVAVLK